MDAKMAIKILHNNQYQKHLGNGEYDYIHPLTDAEVKGIEDLIERQDQKITRLEAQHVFDNSQLVEYEEIVRVQAAKIERQEKIIDRAIGQLRKSGCPIFIAKKCLDQQEPLASECPPDRCWRRWLEGEARNELA